MVPRVYRPVEEEITRALPQAAEPGFMSRWWQVWSIEPEAITLGLFGAIAALMGDGLFGVLEPPYD